MSASDNNLTGPQSQTRPKVIYLLKRKITTATTTTTSTTSTGSASYSHSSPAQVNINQVDPTRGLAGELSSNFWQSQVLGSGTGAGGVNTSNSISYNQAGLGLGSPLTPSKSERVAGSNSMLDLLENIKTEEPEDEGGFNPQLDHQCSLADSVKKEPGEFCGENRESAAGSSFMLDLLDHLEMKIEAQEDGDITEVESFAKKKPGEFCEENNFKLDLFEGMETEEQEGGGRNHNICPYCQKSFHGHLKRHINGVHLGEKQHQCHRCTQTFSRKGDLKRHINGVHVGEKKHKCPVCNKSFQRRDTVTQHIKTQHQK